MEGTPAIYLGRIVEKKNFRAFIYGPNGEKRLAESWEEFEANMQSGIWFATVEDALASQSVAKDVEPVESEKPMEAKKSPRKNPRKKAQSPVKAEPVEEVQDAEEVLADDDTVFEVTDDFLPNESE